MLRDGSACARHDEGRRRRDIERVDTRTPSPTRIDRPRIADLNGCGTSSQGFRDGDNIVDGLAFHAQANEQPCRGGRRGLPVHDLAESSPQPFGAERLSRNKAIDRRADSRHEFAASRQRDRKFASRRFPSPVMIDSG